MKKFFLKENKTWTNLKAHNQGNKFFSTFSYKSTLGLVELNEIILPFMTKDTNSFQCSDHSALVEPQKANPSWKA